MGPYSGPKLLKSGSRIEFYIEQKSFEIPAVATYFKCVNFTARSGACPYTVASHNGVLKTGERPHNHPSDRGKSYSTSIPIYLCVNDEKLKSCG